MKTLRFSFIALGIAILVAACSGKNIPVRGTPQLPTPQSVSPAKIAAAPMARTAILPSSAMQSPVRTQSDIQGLNWTAIPGSATQVAAASDGSLWALSDQPSGPDKYIWHYANGAWSNITGLASQIAVGPDGTLYAINSGGGTFAYSAGNWTGLGGGSSAITAAADGSIYVLSNGGSGPDRAIWHNVNGVWSQLAGSGTAIDASWDSGSYSAGGSAVASGGVYIINSVGGIYYENPDMTFSVLPGSASAIAATTSGGVFVLGYPSNSSGNSIFYYNYSSGTWTSESGAGVSLAANGSNLYVVGASGGIYQSPITPAATPGPQTNFPVLSSVGGYPAYVNPSGFTLYVFTADGVNVSNCTLATYAGCSGTWPPLTADANATASGDFTPITRSDGSKQWAYQGHPLYTYSHDTGPYQSNGDGLVEPDGTSWTVARPAGTVTPSPIATDPPCKAYC
ncbi:MAG TPA: tectonin domain-containing protein [Candidatus Rubrimentiphilum sp.]|nr:tectonin domain-containing protein [Candidatus Rubrimentiphilum sp.]